VRALLFHRGAAEGGTRPERGPCRGWTRAAPEVAEFPSTLAGTGYGLAELVGALFVALLPGRCKTPAPSSWQRCGRAGPQHTGRFAAGGKTTPVFLPGGPIPAWDTVNHPTSRSECPAPAPTRLLEEAWQRMRHPVIPPYWEGVRRSRVTPAQPGLALPQLAMAGSCLRC